MIRTEELRIGNYLKRLDKIIQVGQVKCDAVREQTGDDWESVFISNKDFEPIPLTEQWLLDLGFTELKYDSYTDYQEKCIAVRKFNHGKIQIFEPSEIHPTFTCYLAHEPVELLYVHQLQNLYFALTGVELKREPIA